MINYSVYKNFESDQWVTFVHGAGGVHQFGTDKSKNLEAFNVIY